jgi:hypothetical protein
MKKLLTTSFVIMLVICTNAQVKFGIKGGVNFAKQKWTVSGASISFDSKVGFMAGVILESPFSESLFFQSGVLFSQKGMKLNASSGGATSDIDLTLNYLDVPLNLIYKADAGNVKILLSGGPVLSYGISGKGTANGQSGDIKFGSDEDFKSMDIGLGIGGGVEVSNFQIGLNYTFGLSNISNTSGITMKNNVFTISAAILFGGK